MANPYALVTNKKIHVSAEIREASLGADFMTGSKLPATRCLPGKPIRK
jgi:hypothetical protein